MQKEKAVAKKKEKKNEISFKQKTIMKTRVTQH